jgi:hypothetical protein
MATFELREVAVPFAHDTARVYSEHRDLLLYNQVAAYNLNPFN